MGFYKKKKISVQGAAPVSCRRERPKCAKPARFQLVLVPGCRACWQCCDGAFGTSVFEIKTCDPLFFPHRLQGPIIKGFIKEIESPVENTPLLPTWMELTSFALATGCPP